MSFTVTKVEGPKEDPPEIIGGARSYFWFPVNDGRGFSGRFARLLRSVFGSRADDVLLPNVRNADLAVPVRLGTTALPGEEGRGVDRYAYIMGDTGDRDNPDEHGNNRGGFGGLRITGNAVLLAHKDSSGRIVPDGFIRHPKYPMRPLELFHVETPHVRRAPLGKKVGRFSARAYSDGHARSVVPTGAAMICGRLVVAWQQMDWTDQPPGQWKGEGSFLQEYDLDASATVDSKVLSRPMVALDDPSFQQIQLVPHREEGREVVYILGSKEGRCNDGLWLAKADAQSLLEPSRWRYFDGAGWGVRAQARSAGNVRNVGEGGARVIGDQLVVVYTDGELGVVLRSAPLEDLNRFSPPQKLIEEPVPGGRAADTYFNDPGGVYGGFIEDVDEHSRTITVMISRWNPYSVYRVTVHWM
jgi:hypothetical protein